MIAQKLITNSSSVLSLESKDTYVSSTLKGPTFGRHHNKNVFSREFGSEFLTRESPGPLAYDPIGSKSRFNKGVGTDAKKFSFGKCDRGMGLKARNDQPSPSSYENLSEKIKRASPKPVIP